MIVTLLGWRRHSRSVRNSFVLFIAGLTDYRLFLRKMVSQFREALDQQGPALTADSISRRPMLSPRRAAKAEAISASTSSKQFGSFVRGIGKSNSLLDVRRLRSDVTDQIRKTRALVGVSSISFFYCPGILDDPNSHLPLQRKGARTTWLKATRCRSLSITSRGCTQPSGRPISALKSWVARMSLRCPIFPCLALMNPKIDSVNSQLQRDPVLGARGTRTQPKATLRQILLHPGSLSWFMEFQERRGHSLRVQFWLLAEGLKAPLEDLDSEDEGTKSLPPPAPSVVATAREDAKMVSLFHRTFKSLKLIWVGFP